MFEKIIKFFKPYTPLQKKYLSCLMVFRSDFPFLGRGISNGEELKKEYFKEDDDFENKIKVAINAKIKANLGFAKK